MLPCLRRNKVYLFTFTAVLIAVAFQNCELKDVLFKLKLDKPSEISMELLGLNSARSEVIGSSREVIDFIGPTSFRYPDGKRANFWDPGYWVSSRHSQAFLNPAFDFEYSNVLSMVIEHKMDLNLICNLTTPSAQTIERILQKNDQLIFPIPDRTSTYVGNNWKNETWWKHMLYRATACRKMVRDAIAAGVPVSKLRIELGNELYWGDHQEVYEVFPPDFGADDVHWLRMFNEFTDKERKLYGVEKYHWNKSISCPIVENFSQQPLSKLPEDVSLAQVIKECLFNKKIYGRLPQKLDENYLNRPLEYYAQDLAKHLPVNENYAQAAVYFAMFLKNDFPEISIAAVKADSSFGWTSAVDGNRFRRITDWDSVTLPAIAKYEKEIIRHQNRKHRLIDALVEHDYAVSNPDYLLNDLGRSIRSIYRDLNLRMKLGDEGCVNQSCIAAPWKIWHTEFAFDYHTQISNRFSATQDNRQPELVAYDSSLGRALSTSYMISLLLDNPLTETIQYYDASSMGSAFNGSGGNIKTDSVASVLNLWSGASQGKIMKQKIQISGEALLQLSDSQSWTPGESEHVRKFGVGDIYQEGPLPGLVAWRFYKEKEKESDLIVTNLLNSSVKVSLASIGFTPIKTWLVGGEDVSLSEIAGIREQILFSQDSVVSLPARSVVRIRVRK